MLVLGLKEGEKITIGDNIELMLVRDTKKKLTRVGIKAPQDVEILREGVASEREKIREGGVE